MAGTLISEKYRLLLHAMHKKHKSFGGGSKHRRDYILSLGYDDILDYGCGKGKLGFGKQYDPGVPEFSAEPEPADLVVSTDVLEHIEPEFLENVLAHIASKMRKAGYFTIGCAPAAKKLPDRRNAHLIIKPPEWWVEILQKFFDITEWSTGFDRRKRRESLELEVHVRPVKSFRK